MASTAQTPADLRGEVARRRATLYKLAAIVGVHPGRLGEMLNERRPLPPQVMEKVLAALEEIDCSESDV